MIIVDALQGILSIMLMIAIGYILTEKGWLDEHIGQLFSKLMIYISLPALMISNLMTTFDKKMLIDSKFGLLFPISIIFLSYGIGVIFSKALRIPRERKGIFQALFALSNTIFIGLPVNMAVFGEKSVPYVMLFYASNTAFMWTIGVYGISKSGGEGQHFQFNKETFKKILSPPLIAFIITIFFIIFGIKLPVFIMSSCKYLGNLTTPLSMLFMGIVLHGIKIKDFRFKGDMIMVLLGRFLISPLIAYFVLSFFPAPELMKKVFIMEAAMPAATQITIISQAYKADYQYAMILLGITIVSGLLLIPVYSVLISLL